MHYDTNEFFYIFVEMVWYKVKKWKQRVKMKMT